MAVATPKTLIDPVQLSNVETSVGGPAAGKTWIGMTIVLCNTDSVARTFNLKKMKNGDSTANKHLLFKGGGPGSISIQSGETKMIELGGVVGVAQDTFFAWSDVNAVVNFTLHGAEVA